MLGATLSGVVLEGSERLVVERDNEKVPMCCSVGSSALFHHRLPGQGGHGGAGEVQGPSSAREPEH